MSPEPATVGTVRSAVAVRVAGRRWLSSHSLSPEPTPDGRFSPAFAVDITGPAWFSP